MSLDEFLFLSALALFSFVTGTGFGCWLLVGGQLPPERDCDEDE